MISMGSILFGLGLAVLVPLTLVMGPTSAAKAAVVLTANWLCCMAFVLVTGNYTPWGWFWTMDLFSAVAITQKPVSRWQAVLAYIYMGQLGLHAFFAITGGDPHRYISWLDGLLVIQMALVFTWTGGHGLNRLWRFHRGRALRVIRFSGASDS